MFLKIFFLVKKYTTSSKYAEGGGGEVALRNGVRASLFESFLVFYISDKIYQIGVLYLKNFHFSLSIFKNGVKRSKNPILHDSPKKTQNCVELLSPELVKFSSLKNSPMSSNHQK